MCSVALAIGVAGWNGSALELPALPGEAAPEVDETFEQAVTPETGGLDALVKLRQGRVRALRGVVIPVAAEQMPRLAVGEKGLTTVSPKFTAPGYRAVKLAGSDSEWVVWAPPMVTSQVNYQVECSQCAEAETGGVWLATMRVAGDQINVVLYGGARSKFFAVQLLQEKGRFVVCVWKMNQGKAAFPPKINAAPTLAEARRGAGADLDAYVSAAVRMLGMEQLVMPGATDVYRVFDTIMPDKDAVGHLAEVLAEMESPVPQARAEAQRRLDQLGRREVLAALRLEPGMLGPEEQRPVREFVWRNSTWGSWPIEKLRRDPVFMVNCLEDADERVRTLAATRLGELLKRPIRLPDDPDARTKMMRDLREEALSKRHVGG